MNLLQSSGIDRETYLRTLYFYTQHLNVSVAKAILGQGKLPESILQLEGMSSWSNRFLLNNLCSIPGRYLEIGSWRGSTFISALYENKLIHGTSIDNHQEFVDHNEFRTDETMLRKNCEENLTHEEKYTLITADCWSKPLPPGDLYDIYLYDGFHSYEDQYKAITEYYDNLQPIFYYVCDDYSLRDVEKATQQAFKDMEIEVITEHKMYGSQDIDKCMTTGFWNGYYVALCVKRKAFPQFFTYRTDGTEKFYHRFTY